MITAIFVDNKGFKKAEVLAKPEMTYRFAEHRTYHPPTEFDKEGRLILGRGAEFQTKVVTFVIHHKIADDVYEYREE